MTPYRTKSARVDDAVVPFSAVAAEAIEKARRHAATIVDGMRRQRDDLAHVMRTATLGELAAGLVHEMSQPLNALVATLEACMLHLSAGKADRRTLLRLVREANGDAERVSEVLGLMRDYVRRRSPRLERVDLREVVRRVGTLTRGEARRRRVALRLDPGRLPLVVRIDAVQVEQVLANLVQNGIESITHAGRKTRRVAVRASAAGEGMAEVTVSDTGPGFSTSVDRVFEPFFTTKPKGLGMGLSISRSIVEAHGGRIWIAPGEHATNGTTVRVRLPRLAAKGRRTDGGEQR